MRAWFVVLAWLVFTSTVSAAGLPREVVAALAKAQVPTEALSVLIEPLDGRRPRLAYHETVPRNPASVEKLITSFAAMESFGPSARWQVALYAQGPWQGDTLSGPLVLRHDGDPHLTAERLWKLLRTARAAGLRQVAGFVVEPAPLRLPPWDPGAFDGRGEAPYTQGPAAALVHFNAIVVTVRPHPANPKQLLALAHPPLPVPIDASAVTLSAGRCERKAREYLRALWQGDRLVLAGQYPAACGVQTLALAPPDPEAYAATLLTAIWQELGGTVQSAGQNAVVQSREVAPRRAGRAEGNGETGVLLASDESATLTEILYQMNKWSNNVIARQLLALVGAAVAPQAGDHVAAGAAHALALLREIGADDGQTVIDNGAGLSRTSRVSAKTLAAMLRYVAQQDYAVEFVVGLPRLGEDGTTRRRFGNSVARGAAHLKTGTLRDVRALAGYARDRHGRRYVFVAMIEHPNAGQAAPVMEALLAWLQAQ